MKSPSELRRLTLLTLVGLTLAGIGLLMAGRSWLLHRLHAPSAVDRQWAIDQADTAECVIARQTNTESLLRMLPWASKAAMGAGRLDEAQQWAEQALQLVPRYGDERYSGGILHDCHAVLGRVALARGDIETAKRHLLAAGDTPGSPCLNSFGPNMVLARDLLAHGEKDTVLAYFDECQLFWKMHPGKLNEWRQAIAKGDEPDFGANLAL